MDLTDWTPSPQTIIGYIYIYICETFGTHCIPGDRREQDMHMCVAKSFYFWLGTVLSA